MNGVKSKRSGLGSGCCCALRAGESARTNSIVLKTSTSIFFLVIPPRLRFRLHTNWFRAADCQLLMPSFPRRTESYRPERKRHRTIVNTVSLLRLTPVGSVRGQWRKRIARPDIRHPHAALRPWHVDDFWGSSALAYLVP